MLKTFTHHEARHPTSGDQLVTDELGHTYWDRHGVIGTQPQLDAIAAVRAAIYDGWASMKSGATQGRVFSAASLPDLVGNVIVASWNGSRGWIVSPDGVLSRSSIRYETDSEYNIYEVS